MVNRLARYEGPGALLLALILASGFCVSLLLVRVAYTGRLSYAFLLVNLFLAWMPFVFAAAAWLLASSGSRLGLALACPSGVAWLLFFPNAPYLVTDLMHLRVHANGLFWFDIVTLPSFAWTGLVLGFASLYLMQGLVARHVGRLAGWGLAALALGLAAFGIYLGRFRRWNSWDVVAQPLDLLADVAGTLFHPFRHVQTFAFSLILASFLFSAYLVVYAFANLSRGTRTTV